MNIYFIYIYKFKTLRRSLWTQAPEFKQIVSLKNEVTGGPLGGRKVYSIVLEHVVIKNTTSSSLRHPELKAHEQWLLWIHIQTNIGSI